MDQNGQNMQSVNTNKRVAVAGIGVIIVFAAIFIARSRTATPPAAPVANTNAPLVNAPAQPPQPVGLVGVYDNATAELVAAETVTATSTTQVTVTGQAVGYWYFEASFPVEIKDNANNVIGQGIAQAQSDWMVATMVPFVANITLNVPYSGPATVILHKDNPSGEPANEASVSYAVTL